MRRWGVGGGGPGGGILRKTSPTRKPQLLVFGYSCKLFRDDERALDIELGRHLIPCMSDESLKIDRYDARGALGSRELAAAENSANSGRGWERLTPEEQRVEQLCDEERYRALYRDEDEEEMYREEELKRIHMTNNGKYGQVEFNYDYEESAPQTSNDEKNTDEPTKVEEDEPFIPPPNITIPEGMPVPDTQKLNLIIEKTASFIASHGTQMEILLKAKQSGNPQFEFLSLECPLHAYYELVLTAIKEGRFKLQEEVKEEKIEEEDHYLHPSLAPLSVESAPSIPSISYKPSADCAYSMLVNQIKGTSDDATQSKNEAEENAVISTDVDLAPPGTETVSIVPGRKVGEMPTQIDYSNVPPELMQIYAMHGYYNYPPMMNQAEISKAPVLYNTNNLDESQIQDGKNYPISSGNVTNPFIGAININMEQKFTEGYDSGTNSPKPSSVNKISTGLKLTHYYNSDSENDSDGNDDNDENSSQTQLLEMPPPDQQLIIDKMASYVARNGNDFEQIVRMKGDPRFSFLDASHIYNPYYKHKRSFYERINKPQDSKKNNTSDKDEESANDKKYSEKKVIAPVSFSIKKIKEPEPILPKPALPYESTSEEETESNPSEQQEVLVKNASPNEKLQSKVDKSPEVVVTKVETKPEIHEPIKTDYKPKPFGQIYQIQSMIKEPSLPVSNASVIYTNVISTSKIREIDRKEQTNKRTSPDVSEYDEYKKRKRKRFRNDKNDISSDIITIDEENDLKNSSECIDLTEECNDDDAIFCKDNIKTNSIQLERKKRAVAFLSSLKTSTTPIEHHNTLASAMVKTLHTLRNKDEKSSPRRKRRRERSSSRKSKRKKSDRKHSNDRYNDSDDDYGDDWKQSSRGDSYKSRSHSRERYSKKSKKRSSKDRSPDYYRSRSHKKSKTSSRDHRSTAIRESSLETILSEAAKSVKSSKNSISRKNDDLLTTSLKELVREARKDMTPSQPIKMAVDIFANDQPNICASDNELEKDSSNDGKKTKSKSSSSSSSDTEDSADA